MLESDETFQLSATDTSRHAMASSNNGGTALITIYDDDSACEYNIIIYNYRCIIIMQKKHNTHNNAL